ncbi:hypothetical protein HDK90DRAFT_461666 [Phyllosticta capitalensis]|uniref:Uncharacterized protein n=2 Tax=Phyllosticta capitalensis TaxID=121624 RepID=A0ABR1Z391_9PEZI
MSTAPSNDVSLVSNAPAVAQWTLGNGEQRFLGDESPSPAFLDLSFDEKSLCMYCRLRVAVKLKSSDKKAPLYHLLEPRHFLDLEALNGFVPEHVVSAFVRGDKCSTSGDIVGLRMTLHSPGFVVGPKDPTSPKTPASRKILEHLFSLGQATNIIVYLPSSAFNATRFEHMRSSLLQGLLKFDRRIIDTLYAGGGGRPLHDLKDLSALDSPEGPEENLPSYAEAALLKPQASRRRKREAASPGPHQDGHLSAKKPREVGSAEHSQKSASQGTEAKEPWQLALADQATQVALLVEQVAALQKELHARRISTADAATQTEAPRDLQDQNSTQATEDTVSTVADGIEDRVEMAERSIAALRGAVCQIQGSLPAQLADAVRQAVQESAEACDDHVARELEELRDEIDADTRHEFEDQFIGVKMEMEDFVREELRDVEENIKNSVKHAVRTATLEIDFEE